MKKISDASNPWPLPFSTRLNFRKRIRLCELFNFMQRQSGLEFWQNNLLYCISRHWTISYWLGKLDWSALWYLEKLAKPGLQSNNEPIECASESHFAMKRKRCFTAVVAFALLRKVRRNRQIQLYKDNLSCKLTYKLNVLTLWARPLTDEPGQSPSLIRAWSNCLQNLEPLFCSLL